MWIHLIMVPVCQYLGCTHGSWASRTLGGFQGLGLAVGFLWLRGVCFMQVLASSDGLERDVGRSYGGVGHA